LEKQELECLWKQGIVWVRKIENKGKQNSRHLPCIKFDNGNLLQMIFRKEEKDYN